MDQSVDRSNACFTCKHAILVPENTQNSCIHPLVVTAVMNDPEGTYKEYEDTGIIGSVATAMGITSHVPVQAFGWPVDYNPVDLKTCNQYEENTEVPS